MEQHVIVGQSLKQLNQNLVVRVGLKIVKCTSEGSVNGSNMNSLFGGSFFSSF